MNAKSLLHWSAAGLLLACAAPAPALAAPVYTPTMADMMSINRMIHFYMDGLDKHDPQAMGMAFDEDGVLMLFDRGKLLIEKRGRAAVQTFVAGPPAGTPPPGAAMAPSRAPPTGAAGAPPPMRDMFHFIANDHYDFESPTRVKHYAYWMDVTPGEGRTSTLGIPGHYEDVFVKRGADWYILERRIYVGTK